MCVPPGPSPQCGTSQRATLEGAQRTLAGPTKTLNRPRPPSLQHLGKWPTAKCSDHYGVASRSVGFTFSGHAPGFIVGILATLLFQSLFGQRCDVCSSTHGANMYQLQAKSLQAEVAVAQRLLTECREGKKAVEEVVPQVPTMHLQGDIDQSEERGGYAMGTIVFLVDVGLLYFCLHHIMCEESKNDVHHWVSSVLLLCLGNRATSLQQCSSSRMPGSSATSSSPCQHFEIGTPRGRSRKWQQDTSEILSEGFVLATLSAAAICIFRILEIVAGTGVFGHFVRYLAITVRVCLLVLLVLF